VIRLPQSVLYFIAEFGWRFRLRSVSEVPGVLTRYFCYPPQLDTQKIKKTINISFKYSSRQAVEEAIIRKKNSPGRGVAKGIRYGCQFLGSLLILGAPLTNPLKLVLFLLLWAATFRPVARREWLAVMFVCLVFTGMDIGAIRKGVFYFLHPDVAGLPLYEPFVFGFLALNAMRLLKGPLPQRRRGWLVYALAVLFMIPFQLTARSDVLFWTTLAILLATLSFFHEKLDIAYAGARRSSETSFFSRSITSSGMRGI
jgi:hypothetical protein